MGKTILILDEDDKLSAMVGPLLEKRGHKTLSASSGRDGLDIVKEKGFGLDLVIVSEKLSDIDGIGWIVKLRQVTNDVKIVYISNTWKDAELYQKLTKEFAVDLVVHRPIKGSLFPVQVESLFAKTELPVTETVTTPKGLEATLEALREKYQQVLPERVSALAEAVKKGRSDPAVLPDARRLAHNLKGTASSSGFEPIGQAAGRIEKALDAIMKQMTSNPDNEWMEIEASLAVAIAEAERVAARNGQDKVVQVSSSTLPDLAKARILVMTPDPLPMLDGLEGPLPVELIKASSPPEAMDRACVFLLDAALIDASSTQPEASFDLARSLRALKGYENLPFGFILDSAKQEPQHRSSATHAGASLYLDKPLTMESFQKAVQYLIGVREGGRARVLIVDDDEDFASMIAVTLAAEGVLVRSIQDPSRTLALMEEFIPDILLLDVNMPGVSGFDVCRMLRSTPRWQDIPILFLTAETGLDARITAFDAGGDDYLPKPVANVELLTRVKVRLERSKMLKDRADKDVLTGLLMRRAFMEQLDSLMAEARRHNFKFCTALLDIDHFKKINDTYGHFAGDRVLTYFGSLLKMRFRVEDLRGRWGGEEFIMAFRHETKDTMKGALNRVLDELSKTTFKGDADESFIVTFSSGMASYPEDGGNLHEILQVADKRLYIAKESGRKRVVTDG